MKLEENELKIISFKVIKSDIFFVVINKCLIVNVLYVTQNKFKRVLKWNENKFFNYTNIATKICKQYSLCHWNKSSRFKKTTCHQQ